MSAGSHPGTIAELEVVIGHRFEDSELLIRALTHKSRAHEEPGVSSADSDNEQLEFLGDSVLGFVISDSLVQRFPEAPEGRLSKLKSHLVSAARLYEVAKALELGQHLRLGRGEEMSGGRSKRALLADAVEALIAAVYLDGGINPARQLIERWVLGSTDLTDETLVIQLSDHKSELQEEAQARKLPLPRYVIVNEEGPEHAKVFTVEARLGKRWTGRAQGQSKKSAGQKAAKAILEQLATEPAEELEDEMLENQLDDDTPAEGTVAIE